MSPSARPAHCAPITRTGGCSTPPSPFLKAGEGTSQDDGSTPVVVERDADQTVAALLRLHAVLSLRNHSADTYSLRPGAAPGAAAVRFAPCTVVELGAVSSGLLAMEVFCGAP